MGGQKEWEGRRRGRQDKWEGMKSGKAGGVVGQEEWEGRGSGSGRADGEGAQPSCAMSDTRLSVEMIKLCFALTSYNPCES